MSELSVSSFASRWQRLDKGQLLKWTVYTLLMLNWAYYAWEEWSFAQHTLRHGASLMEWLEAFATTLDELAWFSLLLMFELETYILEDDAFERRWVVWTLHGLRLLCYLFLAHTVLARYTSMQDAWQAPAVPAVTELCSLVDRDISWGSNYDYHDLTPENCAQFTSDQRFYMIDPQVITDQAGWEIEKQHTLIELIDALTWLLVIWAVELAVRLQNRNITGGMLMLVSHAGKALYALLFLHAGWWVYTGHPIWAWDQVLWILGFWAIEHNLSEWRQELRSEEGRPAEVEA